MIHLLDAKDLYSFIEITRNNFSPVRLQIMLMQELFKVGKISNFNHFMSSMEANMDIMERLTRKYIKPKFNIYETVIDNKTYLISENVILRNVFCELKHFVKLEFNQSQPKMLIIAPMAGHFATLLRGTVKDSLPYFDVYITDWVDANQVPIENGSFDLNDFIDYVIHFIKFLGPDVHIMAVCQPTIPALAATALLSEDNSEFVPKSMTLMGGPIDARHNPTIPDNLALSKNLQWFDQFLITSVPSNYPGHRRRVYPGFFQLVGFILMNLEAHVKSHVDLFKDLVTKDEASILKKKSFYDEYLSVMDITAEFYLQTIKEVFKEFSLAKGKFFTRGRRVNLSSITECAILGIEGERDDIASVGQTKAALFLCKNLAESKKKYYLQKNTGHYGIFSGSKFRNNIVPLINDFVQSNR